MSGVNKRAHGPVNPAPVHSYCHLLVLGLSVPSLSFPHSLTLSFCSLSEQSERG